MKPSLSAIRSFNLRLAAIEDELKQAHAELGTNRHIDDDAQRDALVSERYEDLADARATARDVRRVEKLIAGLEKERTKLITKRDRMIEALADL